MRLSFPNEDLRSACLSARWVSEGANTHSTTHCPGTTETTGTWTQGELGAPTVRLCRGGPGAAHPVVAEQPQALLFQPAAPVEVTPAPGPRPQRPQRVRGVRAANVRGQRTRQ